jgi:hypothetical protein
MKDKIEKANNCERTQKYISRELTHLTKTYETLCDILNDQILLGGPDIEVSRKGGIEYISWYKKNISENAMIEVNKVCFSDIPEGQMDIHKQKYGHYGISFDKDFIVRNGGIPVHYVPCAAAINSRWSNAGETRADFFDRLTKEMYEYFDSLIVEHFNDTEKREKFQRLHEFIEIHIKPYFKFFDHTLPDADMKNYYFEREWCVVGSVKFKMSDIRNVLLPQEYESKLKKEFPEYKGPINSKS